MEDINRQLAFVRLAPDDKDGIRAMSRLATDILREHYDPLLGKAQNDYMLAKFQSVDAIGHQLESGYRYFFVRSEGQDIKRIRSEKNDIGGGYFMDDYVYAMNVDDWQPPKRI